MEEECCCLRGANECRHDFRQVLAPFTSTSVMNIEKSQDIRFTKSGNTRITLIALHYLKLRDRAGSSGLML